MSQNDTLRNWEAVGGPYDGALLPAYGTQLIVKQFERSPTSYVYRRTLDDTGAPYWAFWGVVPLTTAAA